MLKCVIQFNSKNLIMKKEREKMKKKRKKKKKL